MFFVIHHSMIVLGSAELTDMLRIIFPARHMEISYIL